jgi:hypothetical protein
MLDSPTGGSRDFDRLSGRCRFDTIAFMENDNDHNELPPELERYLALCQRIYERMERDGTWPWRDSTDAEDLIDSKDSSSAL